MKYQSHLRAYTYFQFSHLVANLAALIFLWVAIGTFNSEDINCSQTDQGCGRGVDLDGSLHFNNGYVEVGVMLLLVEVCEYLPW
jgi:hypothetical protein